MLLVVIDESLQSACAFLPQAYAEFGFIDHDRVFIGFRLFGNIGLTDIEVSEFFAAMLEPQYRIRHTGHERAVLNGPAVKPEAAEYQYDK